MWGYHNTESLSLCRFILSIAKDLKSQTNAFQIFRYAQNDNMKGDE